MLYLILNCYFGTNVGKFNLGACDSLHGFGSVIKREDVKRAGGVERNKIRRLKQGNEKYKEKLKQGIKDMKVDSWIKRKDICANV
jgi:hypothetical protein